MGPKVSGLNLNLTASIVCGKVMFSQACVKNSVHGGGGGCGKGGVRGRGHVWWGVHGRGTCMARETATAADGTHPTGRL